MIATESNGNGSGAVRFVRGICFCGKAATYKCVGEGIETNRCRAHAKDLSRWSFAVRPLTKFEAAQARAETRKYEQDSEV